MALEHRLEAVLFFKGEPETKGKLIKLLEAEEEEFDRAVNKLDAALQTRGIRLLKANDSLELVTAPESSGVINTMRKEELVRDLGKAGAETLAIILYKAPVSRSDIEYVRGVNCSFILRNLSVRGLIERAPKQKGRAVLYQPTTELLKHLGVTSVQELPDHDTVLAELKTFEEARREEEAVAEEAGEQAPPIQKETTI